MHLKEDIQINVIHWIVYKNITGNELHAYLKFNEIIPYHIRQHYVLLNPYTTFFKKRFIHIAYGGSEENVWSNSSDHVSSKHSLTYNYEQITLTHQGDEPFLIEKYFYFYNFKFELL